jgi:phenylpropionate dioxygenase-like ring-hydroxylating dioxygenase large terminal subunit
MTFFDQWVPVALSADVEAGTSTGTRIAGREFVVWRDSSGLAHVWEDRCPHRGMRLSFGFVRGDHLACLYHGWQFAADGQCRLIPAHPDIKVPSTIKATRFGCTERAGIIWSGPEDRSPPDDGPATPVRTMAIEAPLSRVRQHLPAEAEPLLARCDIAELPVLAALQPLSDRETALHLVITAGCGPAGQKAVAAWGAHLRDRIEAAVS